MSDYHYLICHVYNSGNRLAIAYDAISQIVDMGDHAAIKRVDGGTVEVAETFDQVFAYMEAPAQ